MIVSEALKTQVCILERKIRENSSAIATASTEINTVNVDIKSQWNDMNFRERHLGGWFGGSMSKVAVYHHLRSKKDVLQEQMVNLRETTNNLASQMNQLLCEHLKADNEDFRSMFHPYEAALKMKKAVDVFLSKIDNALSEIDDAETSEFCDLATDNIAVSVWSSIECSEASDAISEVNRAAKDFQRAIDTYNSILRGYRAPHIDASVDDTMDLIFDCVFDGFDFMSLFTLSALNNAESSLRTARRKVEEVEEAVSKQFDQAKNAIDLYTQRARVACV